jgi:hypothetical protein
MSDTAAKRSFMAHEWARKRNEQKQRADDTRRAPRPRDHGRVPNRASACSGNSEGERPRSAMRLPSRRLGRPNRPRRPSLCPHARPLTRRRAALMARRARRRGRRCASCTPRASLAPADRAPSWRTVAERVRCPWDGANAPLPPLPPLPLLPPPQPLPRQARRRRHHLRCQRRPRPRRRVPRPVALQVAVVARTRVGRGRLFT